MKVYCADWSTMAEDYAPEGARTERWFRSQTEGLAWCRALWKTEIGPKGWAWDSYNSLTLTEHVLAKLSQKELLVRAMNGEKFLQPGEKKLIARWEGPEAKKFRLREHEDGDELTDLSEGGGE